MVDYELEVSSQPIAARIQIGRSRRSSCKKLQAYDSDVIEMVEVHLFQTMRCEMHHHQSTIRFIIKAICYSSSLRQDDAMKLQFFMQDGALQFIARCVKELLHLHFGDERIISR